MRICIAAACAATFVSVLSASITDAGQFAEETVVDLSPVVTIGGSPCIPIGENAFRCPVTPSTSSQE